jgi:hypothetical protein
MRWFWLFAAVSVTVSAGQSPKPQDPDTESAHTPTEVINRVLPRSLRFTGEYRARWEGLSSIRFTPESNDHYLLTRVRLALTVTPATWFQASVQVHDARIAENSRTPTGSQVKDQLDVRQAWFAIKPIPSVSLQIGRQEISMGDQRIVGPSNWGNTSRSFDAVRLGWRNKAASMEVFAASVVAILPEQLNRHNAGDNLHGFVFHLFELPAKTHIETYGLWRLAPRVVSENGDPGKADTKTVSFRALGEITSRTRYVTEMAVQRGSRSSDSVRAWAGNWRLTRDLDASAWKPAATLVYDYATGDADPADGRYETFDVFYPTPHDKYGLSDQVGWRNIHHAEARIEVSPLQRWKFELKHHAWWLASARDGLYSSGGGLVARDPAGKSGRYVGREVDVQALWNPAKRVAVGTGVGRLWPGEFVKKTTPGARLTYAYVMVTYGF